MNGTEFKPKTNKPECKPDQAKSKPYKTYRHLDQPKRKQYQPQPAHNQSSTPHHESESIYYIYVYINIGPRCG